MNSLKSIYRKLEGQCLDPLFMWGVEEDTEAYEFECDSLSQVDCIESINKIESLVDETFQRRVAIDKLMEIKQVEGGEYVLLKDNKVAERGSYRKCNEMLDAYIDVYEWINGISNKLNQNN